MLDELVRRGVDIDACDANGESAIFIAAAAADKAEQLRWFINAGARLDIANTKGCTPLHAACMSRSSQSVLLLLAAGADVHAVTRFGTTAAAHVSSIRVAAIRDAVTTTMCALLAAGADIDAPFPNDQTTTPRRQLAVHIGDDAIDEARRAVAKLRLDFVRYRALQVCIGLQARALDALTTCEILVHACGPIAPLVPFHTWWAIATTVKHSLTA